MDYTSDELSETSSPMSYDLDKGKRLLLRAKLLCAVLLAASTLLILLFGPFDLSHMIVGLIFLLILGAIIRFYVRSVIAFRCSNTALEITMALGRNESIDWQDIRLFKRKKRCTVLESSEHPAFYFQSIPDDILCNLASIMRETTNARVIGFGEEL